MSEPIQPGNNVARALHLTALGSAVAILLAPQVFPACGGRLTFESTSHHCNHTFAVTSGLALVALAVSIASWRIRNASARIVFAVLLAALALGVLAAPLPWALGICRRADMSCHQTALATAITATVLLAASIGLLLRSVGIAVRERAAQADLPDPWEAAPGGQADEKGPAPGGRP